MGAGGAVAGAEAVEGQGAVAVVSASEVVQ